MDDYEIRAIQLPEKAVLLRENIRHPNWEKKGPLSHEGLVRYYRYAHLKNGVVHILQRRQNGPDVGAWYPAVVLQPFEAEKITELLRAYP